MMQELERFLNTYFKGNAPEDLFWFVGLLLGGYLIKSLFSWLISRGLYILGERLWPEVQGTVNELVHILRSPLEGVFMWVVVHVAFEQLTLSHYARIGTLRLGTFRWLLEKGYEAIMILLLTRLVIALVRFVAYLFQRRAAKTLTRTDDQLVPFVRDFVIVLLMAMGFMILLGRIFSVDVGKILAGLGVGGIAIALAARETLENLLASVTIFMDRPFVSGDAVQVGTVNGEIEKIGFRSTRIRTFDGSMITVPNKNLVTNTLENQTQREFRRARFVLKISPETQADVLRQLLDGIRGIIRYHDLTRTKDGMVRFEGIGEQSLDVLVLYYVETTDFTLFNEIKEEINFRILQLMREKGVHFAVPLSGIYLKEGQELPFPSPEPRSDF